MKDKNYVHSISKNPKDYKSASDTSKKSSGKMGKGQVYKNNLLNVDTTSGYAPTRRIK